ncbi:uncharacterized protein LOC114532311 isoform X2 [Dendronephthya gigantea]|uniref:uncharacterized protein LOC114532311 isoform X2 n=1 Tax=Dendronephthya gigantea TaxID=151771 RepID=UPI0010692258|nr:uncharacterized protein LOC114532311 isoform X2 [Dendronephthya gigantea]
MRVWRPQTCFLICMILKLMAVVILASLFLKKTAILFVNPKLVELNDFQIFMNDWCRVRQARTETQSILASCQDQLKWTYDQNGTETNASMSFISKWDLKPAGQFSRFFIQTVSSEGALKTTGGDWWRVRIRSSVASLPSTVFDHRDGTYEVIFLIVEHGIYYLDITLDHSLCNGFKDPPQNWFILGNAQGKMQPNGVLRGRAKQDYLLQPFQDGRKLTINIGLPDGRGLFVFNSLPRDILLQLGKKFDLSCGMKCQMIWDGYGRWADEKWKPYLKARDGKVESKNLDKNDDVSQTRSPLYNTLWIYGDSQAKRMYEEVQNTSLCKTIFRVCKLSSNWVYAYEGEMPRQDDLDFDYKRITNDIKRVLDVEEMSENSVMVLNLGLHFVQATNFSNYIKLLRGVVDVIETRQREGKKNVRLIWKTTTEISKHKDTKDLLYCDFKRFFTNARVAMYNAYATSFMCQKGFEILDVHPLTASYPGGTGGPKIEFYKEHDVVHYKRHVTKPFEDLLTEYLLGNVPRQLNFKNYQFS